MSFLETPRFPETVSFGFTGGPGFQTDVVIVDSGREFRTQNWSQARRTYEASYAARLPAAYRPLQAFFHTAAGKANGFRVKDWSDFQDSDAGGAAVLGIIDATHFQLYKRYTAGAATYDRIIQKPVSGKVTITGTGAYTLDTTTGIVTKTSGADPTGWTGEFDVPCRFDTDEMKIDVMDRAGTDLIIGWSSIPIIEIRV